jgi:uncharacterized protein (TIGR00255 family)
MMKSMTAYGRGEYTEGETVFTAEVKSVNHRYRDIFLKMPRSLQPLEDEIRSEISKRIKRGRLEVTIKLDTNGGETEYELELNLPQAKTYLRILNQLNEEFGLDPGIRAVELAAVKDVIGIQTPEPDLEMIRPGLIEALRRALDSLDHMRLNEGSALAEDLKKRIRITGEHMGRIKDRSPVVVEEYRRRLKEKVSQLSEDVEIDEDRLAQEIAFFASRCDITEEIVRGESHLDQLSQYMSKEGTVGRRLEFIMQEINREVNTISAKANDASISGWVVEIKAELEKMREQIQNVE